MLFVFSARCNIIHLVLVLRCQCPSVCVEVHWRIIANLPNLPRIVVAVHAGARGGIIAGKSGGIISRYASHC